MSTLVELVQSLIEFTIDLISVMIEAIVRLATGRPKGAERPGWVHGLSIAIALALLAAIGFLIWSLLQVYALIIGAIALVLVAIAMFFS
jgi:hypothetical protein